jgi:hypothetical protein
LIGDDLTRKLGDAGVDLGAMGIQWGRRPDELPACSVTARDLRLLRFLHDFGYATTSTLAALFWGRYGSAVRERLKLLHDVGLVDKLRPRVGRTEGAPEWIYRLTERGWRMLRKWGEPADREAFRPAKLTSIAYVEHDVQVSALMASIAARAAVLAGRTGPLIDAAPFTLLGPRAGTMDPRVEQRAADASAASELGDRRVQLGIAHPGVLKPDATLVGTDVGGNRTAVMIEFDRTRRPSKQLERLRRYDWFLASGWRQSRYANLDIEPAVLIVCDEERQVGPFVRAAEAQLTALVAGTGTVDFVGREQVGFTSWARVLEADDAVDQVLARRPGDDRARAGVRRGRLSLDRLFLPEG